MINAFYQIYSLIFAAVFVSATEGGLFFQKEGTTSLLTPGVKDYAFPVKLVRVTNTVAVPVPYPIHVTKKVPYPVAVSRPVPYPVPQPVPVQVTKPYLFQQAVPVPVVKPVAFPQPMITQSLLGSSSSQGLTSTGAQIQGKNNYLNYLGYQNFGTRPLFNTKQMNPAPVTQPAEHMRDFRSNSYEYFNPLNNFGSYGSLNGFSNNNYNSDINDYGIGMPSQEILPPAVSAEHGSNEFGSKESNKSNKSNNNDDEDDDDDDEDDEDDDDQGTNATNHSSGSQSDENSQIVGGRHRSSEKD